MTDTDWKARAERAEEALSKIRDALQFGLYRKEGGMRVSADAYWNLSGAEEDMKRTGKADAVCLKTVGRVLSQLRAASEIVRAAIDDERDHHD